MIDLQRETLVGAIPDLPGIQGLAFVYVACYRGAISVLHEDDPDPFRKLEDFPVERRVHRLAVDVRTHRVYAPEEQEGGRPVARMVVFEAVGGAAPGR